ncbi:GL24659 [Drosophila persimilis]|uniref:GL24659 n=1 Tax=Drosophila persimilis TaxID=7234 RepID=B4H5W2_DROPE|nr:GL24659 [Drosophila persimilis]
MLAIKECLIREGVLNLDSHSHSHSPYQLNGSKSSSNMDMPRYRTTTDKLATFWASASSRPYSPQHQCRRSCLRGGAAPAPGTSLMPRRGGGMQPDSSSSADSFHALHSSHKFTNLVADPAAAAVAAKAASLPPQGMEAPPQPHTARCVAPPHHYHRSAKSLEPSAKTTAPPPSADVRNYDAGRPVSTDRLFVAPPKVPVQAVKDFKRRLINQGDGREDGDASEGKQFDQGEVFDTLARWQKELTSASDKIQLLDHPLHPDHDHQSNVHHQSLPSVEPPVTPKHQHQLSPQHQHQATNARSDSSYSSPSPTRRRNKPSIGALSTDPAVLGEWQ